MKYLVLGIQDVNYVSKKTGKKVQGMNLHCMFKQKNVIGESVEKLYISSNIDSPIVKVGDEVDVFYNRFGSVDEVRLSK